MDKFETPTLPANKPKRLKRISAIAGAGLLAGLIAAGIGGVASAQTVVIETPQPAAAVQVGNSANSTTAAFAQGDDDATEDSGFNPDDDAVFERYDQCLQAAGLDIESEEEDIDEATFDAAFEQCEPILEELSGAIDGFELSPEDEALFERYDECLENTGLDFETDGEIDDAALDAAFEQCDPILEDLTTEFGDVSGLSDADEAVFDRYEQCLNDGGVEALFDAEPSDEAAIDALFERCDPILEELSEDAQAMFDCPDEDEHNGVEEDTDA